MTSNQTQFLATARKTGNCNGGPPVDGWIAEWATRQEAQSTPNVSSRRALLVRSPAVANLAPLIHAAQARAPSKHTKPEMNKQDGDKDHESDADDDDDDDMAVDPSFRAPPRTAMDLEAAQHLTLLKLDGLTPRGPTREDRRHKRDILREAAVAEIEFRKNLGAQRRMRLAGRLETSLSEPRRHSVNQVINQFLTAQPAIVLHRND